MNDINKHLNEGKKVTIKVIMYADDIVIIAESSYMMKMMLNRMYMYLDKNNLKINMEKTKIMIFNKPPGKVPKTDRFYRNGKEIEKVLEYKYLGIIVRQDLSYIRNNEERGKKAKRAIAITWKNIIGNNDIAEEVKNGIYTAAVEIIIIYGAEIWGGVPYTEVEKVNNYYWKRLFKIPTYTPNYMIYTELGERQLFEKTLKRSILYNLKIMQELRKEKYIVRVAEEMNRTGCGFVNEIDQMCSRMGMQVEERDLEALQTCREVGAMYVRYVAQKYEVESIRRARRIGK